GDRLLSRGRPREKREAHPTTGGPAFFRISSDRPTSANGFRAGDAPVSPSLAASGRQCLGPGGRTRFSSPLHAAPANLPTAPAVAVPDADGSAAVRGRPGSATPPAAPETYLPRPRHC